MPFTGKLGTSDSFPGNIVPGIESSGSISGPIVGNAGIVSEEAFGAGGSVTGPIVGDTGIPSAEAFGAGGRVAAGIVGDTGIPSAEAFGADGSVGSVGGPINGNTGIPSAEAFGAGGSVTGPIVGDTGIPSAEAFGAGGDVGIRITGVNGIPSEEFFPTSGKILRGVGGLIGIPSAEAFGSSGAILQLDATFSFFSIYVGNNLRTPLLRANTLKVDRQLNFQSAANFALYDEAGAFHPPIGAEVLVFFYEESTATWHRIFGGTVNAVETVRNVNDIQTFDQVTCTDYAQALSRRFLNMKYPQTLYGNLTKIMKDISDRILKAEGIQWVDRGDPGVTIPDIEFNFIPVNEVLDRLMEIVNWEWQVDFSKNLYTFDRPAVVVTAPHNLVESPTSDVWRDVTIRRDRGLYRNRQHIKANFTQTTTTRVVSYICPQNITAPPSDFSVQWLLSNFTSATHGVVSRAPFFVDSRYKGNVERIITIKLNGVEQVFFTQQNPGGPPANPPAGWQWMQIWERDLDLVYNMLGFDPNLWPKSGDVLEITFEQLNDLPAPITEENAVEITARQLVEGGTGVYEALEEVVDIQDRALLVEYAKKLLDRFSVMGLEIDFETDKFGFEPGQQLTVNLPLYGVPSTVVNVENTSYQEAERKLLRTQIKVSNQIQQRDALTAFQRLIRRMRRPANKNQASFTFDLAVTYPGITNPGLVTGNNLTNEYLIGHENGFTLEKVQIFFKTAPTGSDIIIDIKANGTSIFPVGSSIKFPAAGTSVVTYTAFADAPKTLSKGTRVRIDISQVGSNQPGKDGTVTVTGWV